MLCFSGPKTWAIIAETPIPKTTVNAWTAKVINTFLVNELIIFALRNNFPDFG